MQKIMPCLWFDNKAEEAMSFYMSLFDDARVISESRYGEGGPAPAGSLLTAIFQLAGQQFMVLNGGPQFKFNEAISLFVNCETQAEVDRLWNALTADGGEESMCGWLRDKYGLSWQIVPTALGELMSDPNPAKAQAVMQAMLQMRRIEVDKLRAAYDAA